LAKASTLLGESAAPPCPPAARRLGNGPGKPVGFIQHESIQLKSVVVGAQNQNDQATLTLRQNPMFTGACTENDYVL